MFLNLFLESNNNLNLAYLRKKYSKPFVLKKLKPPYTFYSESETASHKAALCFTFIVKHPR
jgi:hypothetical protein